MKLYTYPIKSLRGSPLSTSEVTKHGFPHDRRFMLQKVVRDPATPEQRALKKMTITNFADMSLFLQDLRLTEEGDSAPGVVRVTHHNPDTEKTSTIDIPLKPDVTILTELDTDLHQSPAKAYEMANPINDWFSSCFGYEVVLLYLGPSLRAVLGNLSPNSINISPDSTRKLAPNRSWMSTMTRSIPYFRAPTTKEDEEGLTFTDVAPYLIVTEESLSNISSRLPPDQEMDVTKFRPNIVLSGSKDGAFDEDFWAELKFENRGEEDTPRAGENENFHLILTQNCIRCQSINVDYSTGKFGAGESGAVLKKMMKDRRVDGGKKYSPVFGRYAFLRGGEGRSTSGGLEIGLGDEVEVSKRNEERTSFYWPGLMGS
ncbi:hypothetical protein MMC09_004849 [Bachmanniomyces sp. S44760]|nr:hypothetical protein [Bachmanniomyces sp. S44760]